MDAAVVVVGDKLTDCRLVRAGQVVVLEQGPALRSLMPSLDLALCRGMAEHIAQAGGVIMELSGAGFLAALNAPIEAADPGAARH